MADIVVPDQIVTPNTPPSLETQVKNLSKAVAYMAEILDNHREVISSLNGILEGNSERVWRLEQQVKNLKVKVKRAEIRDEGDEEKGEEKGQEGQGDAVSQGKEDREPVLTEPSDAPKPKRRGRPRKVVNG